MLFPFLIAVSGKLGTGKDYITDLIVNKIKKNGISVSKMAFADQIKINVASYSNFTLDECFNGEKTSKLRSLLQEEGTEKGRNIYGNDIWINVIENWIKLRRMRDNEPEVVVITDCRFRNEYDWIVKNHGLVIRLDSPLRNHIRLCHESKGNIHLYTSIANHSSEVDLDKTKFEYILYNDIDLGKNIETELDSLLLKYINQNLDKSCLFNLTMPQ